MEQKPYYGYMLVHNVQCQRFRAKCIFQHLYNNLLNYVLKLITFLPHTIFSLPPPFSLLRSLFHWIYFVYFIVSVYHYSSLVCFFSYSGLILKWATFIRYVLEILFTQTVNSIIVCEVGRKKESIQKSFLCHMMKEPKMLHPRPNESFDVQQ